ncbi:MAG: sel1 repeat family protein [Nitrospinae bacterium]|nr:sel1 repeat family protein [Nitrospinota bacterium]
MKTLLLLAEQGDSLAQYELGLMYDKAKGIPHNHVEAHKWFSIATRSLDNEVSAKAAECLKQIAAKMTSEQIAEADKLAREWEPKEFSLAMSAFDGQLKDGVKARELGEYQIALKLLSPLAEQGNAEAQLNIAYMYREGQGVPQDDAEAAKWFQKSADQGDADAQYNIGYMQGEGQGVPQDYVEAHKWANLGARSADNEVSGNAAEYREQIAAKMTSAQIAEAKKLAREWKPKQLPFVLPEFAGQLDDRFKTKSLNINFQQTQELAEQGDVLAQLALGNMYNKGEGVPKDYAEAFKWFQKSAEQGDSNAQCILGNMYAEGKGVPQNSAKAVKWLMKSADRGYANAQCILGVIYNEGYSVPQDYVEGYKWCNLAAARAMDQDVRDEALRNRDMVASKMTPAQIVEALKLANDWRPVK